MEKSDFNKYIYRVEKPGLFPEAKKIIEELSNWKLFIISSDPIPKLNQELRNSGLKNYFEKVVGDVHEKSTEIKALLEEFNLDKDSTYYVGDTSGDVEAGKNSGVKTIGITWGFQDKSILSKANPDYLIDDIKQIRDILEE